MIWVNVELSLYKTADERSEGWRPRFGVSVPRAHHEKPELHQARKVNRSRRDDSFGRTRVDGCGQCGQVPVTVSDRRENPADMRILLKNRPDVGHRTFEWIDDFAKRPLQARQYSQRRMSSRRG